MTSQFNPSNPNPRRIRVTQFLSTHLPPPSSSDYLLTPTLAQSLKLSLFNKLLDSIPTTSYLLPRQIAPSNQHALSYFKIHGYSLPKAQKAAQEELRKLKGKDKGRETDLDPVLGSDNDLASGHEYGSDRKGMPCGHVFKEGEPIYRCRDCGLDDTCVQCAPCFNASNHSGHDIVFSISSQGGGCCDCGDEEAWTQKVGCSYHDHDDEPLTTDSDVPFAGTSSTTTATSSTSDSMQQDSNPFYSSSHKGKEPETSNNAERDSDPLRSLLEPIPKELFSSLSSELQSYLEYVLQVLEHAPDDMTLPKGPDALETFKRLKSLEDLDQEEKNEDRNYQVSGLHSIGRNSTASFEMMDSESENIEGSERDAEDEAEDIFLDGEDGMEEDEEEVRDDVSDLSAGQSWQIDEDDIIPFGAPLIPPGGGDLGDDDGRDMVLTRVVDADGTSRGLRWTREVPAPGPVTEPLGDGLNVQNILSTMSNDGAASSSREREREGSVPISSTSNPQAQPFQNSNSNITPQPPQTFSSFNPTSDVTPTERSYSVILWNDEKHSFSEVIDTIKDASGVDEKVAKEMAERVDKHGREIVEISTKLKRLFQLARIINHIDLAVTIRPSYDVFAEEVAGQVLNFLLDLSGASLYLPDSSSTSDSAHPHDGFVPNASALRALIAQVFLRGWNHKNPSVALQGGMSKEFFDPDDLRNVDGLLLMDSKMWKEARSTTREIWLMIMGTKEVKKELAVRCAKMYPRMMETFILKDREQEHSIVYMTVQLFSVPSIADHLVRTGFLQRLFQILQAVFTGHLSSGTLKLPPRSPPTGQASPQSMPSRQQRCYQTFYDLRYLLQASGVQSQLVSQPEHLSTILDFLALFNAITPDRRASTAHIEFETDVWLTVFHVSSHLGRTARLFGDAFKKAQPSQLESALQVAANKILLSSMSLHSQDPEAHYPMELHRVNYGSASYEVVEFDVENQPVSFHHPMHWLLAEMMKHVSLIDPHGQAPSFEGVPSAIAEVVLRDGGGQDSLLILLEFPLRVIVKLAQTRVGLWVRNGYALRSQAHHYRDNTMRDIMFDQDLYLLQCGFLLVEPDLFLVSIMDRFSLLEWFDLQDGRGLSTAHETYDSDQIISMADEMLLLLITLLSEVSVAASWSMERQVRREIVQFLALGQGTYSELVKNISERLTDHVSFDRCLSQVSHFRPPDGTTDIGIFDLKEECYDEVEPYFYHYTRNQREKAEEILSEKRKKRTGDAGVTIPRKLDIPNGPFKTVLPKALVNPTLLSIVSSSLSNHLAEDAGELPESLVESALHLLMLGSVEDDPAIQQRFLEGISTYVFGKNSTTRVRPDEINSVNQFTLLRLLLSLEDHSKFKAFKPKITWILNKILEIELSVTGGGSFISSVISTWRSSESKGQEETNSNKAEDDRKAAAKARQAAIMQQFSAQQASLLASFDDDEDENEEEDNDEMEGVDGEEVKSEAAPKRSLGSCILCQENLDGSQAFGSLAHVQASRVLRTTPRKDSGYLQQSLVSPLTMDQSASDGKRIRGPDAFSSTPSSAPTLSKGLFPSEDHRYGFYASTCGHLMHLGCFQSYCKSVEQRQGQQIARNHPEDLSRCEFVCPLCKSLGNVILPVPEASSHSSSYQTPSAQLLRQLQTPQINETPLGEWIRKINIDILKCSTSQGGEQHQETEFGTGSFLSWFAEEQYGSFLSNDWGGMADKVDGATIQMIARLLQALKPLSAEARSERSAFRNKTILAPPSRNMYMPEELLAYTVSILEVSQRGIAFNPSNMGSDPLSGSVADSISDQTVQLLRSLLHCMRTLALVGQSGGSSMEFLRQGLLKRLLPHWGGDEAVRSPLLLRNPLTILVEAAILIPDSIRQVTSLMFYASLVQAVFGLAQPSIWPQAHLHSQNPGVNGGFESRSSAGLRAKEADSVDLETAKSIFPDVRWTVANIIGFVGYARGNITLGVDNLDDASLAKLLCSYTLPFLRRSAIIHRVVGIFDERNGGAAPSQSFGSEYTRLLELLKIPPPAQGLPVRAEQQTPIAGLVEGWIKHGYSPLASLFRPLPIQPNPLNNQSSFDSQGGFSNSFASGSGGDSNHLTSSPTLVLEHPQIYELVPLPVDLARLIQTTQTRKCKKCKNIPPEPALCLLCGDLVCFQSFCCEDTVDRRGECNIHLDRCGGATGIFYRVKSNVVLLLHQKNGTFTSSPYLDSHGEIDIGLRKGRPQKLQPQRYDELRKQWLAHGISNIVARKIEALMDQGGWDTF